MIVSIGYLASICLAISLIVKNNIKSRWYNTFGNIFFISYGLLSDSMPVIIANFVLLVINIFQLTRLYKKEEQFEIVTITDENNIAKAFLNFHEKDIAIYFPEFKIFNTSNCIAFLVLRNNIMANIFIAKIEQDGQALVEINYTIPSYRDFKVGQFIFESEKDFLKTKGITKIVYPTNVNSSHLDFLKTMKFQLQKINNMDVYTKEL